MAVLSSLWLLSCCILSTVRGSALYAPTVKLHAAFLSAASPTFLTIDSAKESLNGLIEKAKALTWKKIQSFNPRSKFDGLTHDIFDSGAMNKDGTISFDECYTLVLKLYIELNRDAPLPPPSRSALREIYALSDMNIKKRINRQEFTLLSRRIGRRAAFRTLSHKVSSLALAPVLAQASLQQLRRVKQLPQIAASVVPKPLHPRVLPVITSERFGSTILVVFFVSTLGDVVVKSANFVLSVALPNTEL